MKHLYTWVAVKIVVPVPEILGAGIIIGIQKRTMMLTTPPNLHAQAIQPSSRSSSMTSSWASSNHQTGRFLEVVQYGSYREGRQICVRPDAEYNNFQSDKALFVWSSHEDPIISV